MIAGEFSVVDGITKCFVVFPPKKGKHHCTGAYASTWYDGYVWLQDAKPVSPLRKKRFFLLMRRDINEKHRQDSILNTLKG